MELLYLVANIWAKVHNLNIVLIFAAYSPIDKSHYSIWLLTYIYNKFVDKYRKHK